MCRVQRNNPPFSHGSSAIQRLAIWGIPIAANGACPNFRHRRSPEDSLGQAPGETSQVGGGFAAVMKIETTSRAAASQLL